MRRYELIQKLHFEVTSASRVTPDKANPMIKQLREKLENYELNLDTIQAKIIDVDEFDFQQVTVNLVTAGWDIVKWDVIDRDEDDSRTIDRLNNHIRNLLASWLTKLSFSRYNTWLKITESSFYH